MTEITINIPAEHVDTIRYHLRISLSYGGSSLSRHEPTPEVVSEIRALAAAMDQVGWEGDGERTLTADRDLLREAIERALEYTTDDIGGNWVDRAKLPELIERVSWLSDTLDSLEPEGVPA